MFLVDTNVISEARKGPRANAGVRAFWGTAADSDIYIAVQTIGEIRRGLQQIRARGDAMQAGQLEVWLASICTDYSDRILDFDCDCAQVWGRLMSPHPQHPVDKQIAAIGLLYGLTVVTRNINDFRTTGVALLNPFH